MKLVLVAVIGVAAAVCAALCLVWPLAEVGRLLADAEWGAAMLGPRRAGLLLRGVRTAALAAGWATLMGAALAVGMLAVRPRWLSPATHWAALVTLLTPPYVYAYAWSLVLLPTGTAVGAVGAQVWPDWVTRDGRAVLCLGGWLAPVAAVALAGGWRRAGRAAFRGALLDAGAARALLSAALRPMLPWLGLSLGVCFVLASTEFSVCHLCLVQTLNTEILAEMQVSEAAAATLAWPLIALLAGASLLCGLQRRRLSTALDALGELEALDVAVGPGRSRVALSARLAALAALLLVGLPVVLLAAQVRSAAPFAAAWATYRDEWAYGALQAAGAALVCALLAISADALAWRGRAGRLESGAAARGVARSTAGALFIMAAVLALLPPTLVGRAFVPIGAALGAIRDHWPILSLVNIARFAIIPMVALRLATRGGDREPSASAAADGAGWLSAYAAVCLPAGARMLGAAIAAVFLLALTEVAATTFVNPPAAPNLAQSLLNAIHFGRDEQIVATCLCVVMAVGVICGGALLLGRGGRQRSSSSSTQ